ncbi:MAG: sulfatase, partial [Pirellulales bacterium]|nr:sulfatase [Pirellulales bacterium]
NCYPSRNVLFSSLYPHTNGVEGFFPVQNKYPVLADLMKAGGYYVAIAGKVSHSTPHHPYGWDKAIPLHRAKNPQAYFDATKTGIAASKAADKPFCLNINISDPHKPFYKGPGDPHQPSLVFKVQDVPIPGFLFDHPTVRKELALYYSSVRRADDCVGKVLAALDESGEADDTVVMFLSDHGMPLPFAKTQLYHHSTHTPWVVRWPGKIKPDTVDDEHMISAIDALPTLLDIAGIEHPKGFQGQSFAPLLFGKKQEGRDAVFKEYNEASNRRRDIMRAVQTRKYLYIFNPWSDGTRETRTATFGTATYRTMVELSKSDPKIAARRKLFERRVLEEFYDVENDPDCLKNLIDDPSYKDDIDRLREKLGDWMDRTGDHALEAFRGREDPSAVAAYMAKQEKRSKPKRKKTKK